MSENKRSSNKYRPKNLSFPRKRVLKVVNAFSTLFCFTTAFINMAPKSKMSCLHSTRRHVFGKSIIFVKQYRKENSIHSSANESKNLSRGSHSFEARGFGSGEGIRVAQRKSISKVKF